ncbi:MAG TPA: efflux RND transporter periplasmic adaptor subunit [Herpetosiphonaceae bacterium]
MIKQLQRIAPVLMVALALSACAGGPPANPADSETTTVRRGDLKVTVSSSGTVQPLQSADLTFGVTGVGTVEKIFVTEGQSVKQGQELAALDPRDLEQQVLQAEANLKSAQARLEQARSGNATEQDLAAQQAAVAAANAQLDKARTGNATKADIAGAEAAVRNAQAGLTRARTGNITPADIANAEAAVRAAEAGLQRARTGNITPADIANAEAAVRAAEAQLAAAQRGPSPDQVSAAQARLTQAQQSYQKTAAATSANKSSAQQSMEQAADAVRLAQNTYSSAYWDNQQAQSGIDPKTGQPFSTSAAEDLAKQQYAEVLQTAELQLRQAESRLEQARIAYDNARQQEINDVATAQAQVDDAQTQLNELLKGPKDTSVAQAQAQLDQARAQLQKLRQGGSAADVASAQAQLDQARAQLQKLRQGGTAADIAAARAQVDQAQAQAQKLRQGGSAADIAAAQAQVDQAQAQLDKLSAGASVSDVSIAEAGVSQAQAQLNAAKLSRDKAVLRAPFDGVITTVNISIGDSATTTGASGAPMTVVDDSKLYLDVNVSERDVAQLRKGQAAQVVIDALGTGIITGTVSYIAPAATVVQNVTTYRVRVDLPKQNEAIRVGMNASVEIATLEQKSVLIIPASAIRSVGTRRFVRLKQGTGFVDREIRVGLSNDIEAEVIDGLREGDQIAVLGSAPTAQQ